MARSTVYVSDRERTNKSNKGCGNDNTKQFYSLQMSLQYP